MDRSTSNLAWLTNSISAGLAAPVAAVLLVTLVGGCAPPTSKPNQSLTPKAETPIRTTQTCETEGPATLSPDADGRYAVRSMPTRIDRLCVLILPTDSQTLNEILRGTKTVDYRRSFPADQVSHILFFNTKTLELFATAEVESTLVGDPLEIAELTAPSAGTNLDGARDYFGSRNYGFAITLRNVQGLAKPIGIRDARNIDARFQRPYGYLFLERHPRLNQEIATRLGLSSAL